MAQYWVTYQKPQGGEELVTVCSADTKSLKPRDVRASYTKARKKADTRLRTKLNKQGQAATGWRALRVQCVG